jgi:hypothetical protein
MKSYSDYKVKKEKIRSTFGRRKKEKSFVEIIIFNKKFI